MKDDEIEIEITVSDLEQWLTGSADASLSPSTKPANWPWSFTNPGYMVAKDSGLFKAHDGTMSKNWCHNGSPSAWIPVFDEDFKVMGFLHLDGNLEIPAKGHSHDWVNTPGGIDLIEQIRAGEGAAGQRYEYIEGPPPWPIKFIRR